MELKHGYYNLIAILVVAIWGLTFISTKVLINIKVSPQIATTSIAIRW